MYKRWLRSVVGVAVVLLTACGGGSDVAPAEAPLALHPGQEFNVESTLPDGSTLQSRYRLYSVTTQGDLVIESSSDLMANNLIPLLLSETFNGEAAPQAPAPEVLVSMQRSFYKILWKAVGEHEGSNDPNQIFEEVSDLDARVVDVMDNYWGSGLSLSDYVAFYDEMDSSPELRSVPNAELELLNVMNSERDRSLGWNDDISRPCPAGTVRDRSYTLLPDNCRPIPVEQLAVQRDVSMEIEVIRELQRKMREIELSDIETRRRIASNISMTYEEELDDRKKLAQAIFNTKDVTVQMLDAVEEMRASKGNINPHRTGKY